MWSKTILKAGGNLKLDLTVKVDQVDPSQIQRSSEHPKEVNSTNIQRSMLQSLTSLIVIFLPII